jgi:hypothetical protein
MAIVITEAAEAADTIVPLAKCTRSLVPNVVSKLKCLLSQMVQGRSTAGIATRSAGLRDTNSIFLRKEFF